MTEILIAACCGLWCWGLGFWGGRVSMKWRESPQVPSKPTPPRAPTASQTWESHFGPDGTVIIQLRMSLSDEVQSLTGMVGVTIPPGDVAKDIKARLIQRRADLVDHGYGAGMRVPEMAAAAPGKPRKAEVPS